MDPLWVHGLTAAAEFLCHPPPPVSGPFQCDALNGIAQTMGAGEVSLKEHTILRILMRTNRRFFSNDSGFVQNIFSFDATSEKPDNFLLTEVLFFLFTNRKTIGLINVEGYFTCRQVADALQKLGYVPDDVFLAIQYLARTELIVTDRMNTKEVEWDDSVRVLAAGWVHLRILTERFEYIYGCIPTTPIRDQKIAEQLADLVIIESQRGELDFHQNPEKIYISCFPTARQLVLARLAGC